MGRVAEEALDVLLHTRDGQLCDILIDKAALEAVLRGGTAFRGICHRGLRRYHGGDR